MGQPAALKNPLIIRVDTPVASDIHSGRKTPFIIINNSHMAVAASEKADLPLKDLLNKEDFSTSIQQMQHISRYLLGKDEDEEGKEYRTSFNPDKDPLRVFLENLTAAMAAQAKKTLQLQQKIAMRSEDAEISKLFEKAVACIPAQELKASRNGGQVKLEEQFKKVDCGHTYEPFDRFPSSKGFPELSYQAGQLGEQLKMMGGVMIKTQEEYEFLKQQIVELKTRADKAADNGEIRDKIKRNKNMLVNKFSNLSEETRTELVSVKRMVAEKLDGLGDQIKQTEQNTLWKITDCQELLRDRVSEQHVRQALKNLEERMCLDLEGKAKLSEERIEAVLSEFRKKLREQSETTTFKLAEIKEKQTQMQVRLDLKAEDSDFQEQKTLFQRFKESCEREFDQINAAFRRHDRQFMEIHKTLNGLRHSLDATVRQMNQMMASQTSLLQQIQLQLQGEKGVHGDFSKKLTAQIGGGDALGNIVPPEQLIEVQNQITGLQSKMEAIQRDIEKQQKSQHFQESQILRLETGISRKADRDEMRAALESRAIFQEMNKQMQREFMKLKDQLDNTLRHFEQKFIKMRPDGELKAIQKVLKTKANGEDTYKEMMNHDLRIKNHENVLAQINDELQAFAEALHSTQDYIENIETNSAEVLAGTKSINCLSCGRNQWGQLIIGGQVGSGPSAQGERSSSPMSAKRKMTMKRFGQKQLNLNTQEFEESGAVPPEKRGAYQSRLEQAIGGARQSFEQAQLSARMRQNSSEAVRKVEKKKVKLPLSYQVQNEVKQGYVKS